VVIARRKGTDWYIGAMGNEKPHEISLPLKFLGDGKFKAKVWEDGETPTTLRIGARDVSATDVLELKLAPSGGAAVRIVR
jgi:alpha-glucosidase